MIDTLRLALADFQVGSRNRLTVQPSPYRAESGQPVSERLLWHNLGDSGPVKGVKAYLNAERFSLTLMPVPKSYGHGPVGCGCCVSLSVPRFYSGSNVKPVNRQEAGAVLQQLEQELDAAGIRTDISRATITRLDCFRDVTASEPFGSYQPLFDLLEAKRATRREVGTTYYWTNTQQEICAYDKRHQLGAQAETVQGLPVNLIRFEHRLLNARKVRAETGISTTADLLREYGELAGHYRRALRGSLFRHDLEAVKVRATSELEDVVQSFKASGDRYWLEGCLTAIGAHGIVRAIGFDGFRAMLSRHIDRSNVWRKMQRLERLLLTCETARPVNSVKTLADLYAELKSKALAA